MERDSRSQAVNIIISYSQWIAERVKEVKLAFKVILPTPMKEECMVDLESENIKQLKEEIAMLKKDNVALDSNIQNLQDDYLDLRHVYEEKIKENQELTKKQKTQKEHIFRTNQDLMAANAELVLRNREQNTTIFFEQQWKNLYDVVKQDKQEVLDKLCDLQERFNNLEAMIEEKVREYEERIEEEHWQKLDNEENHQATITQLEEP